MLNRTVNNACCVAMMFLLLIATVAINIGKGCDERSAHEGHVGRPTLAGRKKVLETLKAVHCSEGGRDVPIEKIVVRLKKPPVDRLHENNYSRFVTWHTSESQDRKLRQAASEALHDVITRLPKRLPQVYEWIPYGELELYSTTNRICFLLGDSFAIDNGEACNSNTACVSQRMASLVQQILASNQNVLSNERFAKLSGVAWRNAEKEVFELQTQPVAPQQIEKLNGTVIGSQTTELAKEEWTTAELEGASWDQLDFDANEKVESVVLRLKRAQAGKLASEYRDLETWFEQEVKEPVVLRRVERGIHYATKHASVCGISYSGAIPPGELEIRTKSRNCVVYLKRGAFALKPFNNSNNIFRSWTLAKVVDSLMREGTGSGLPEKRFRNLAGEHSNE